MQDDGLGTAALAGGDISDDEEDYEGDEGEEEDDEVGWTYAGRWGLAVFSGCDDPSALVSLSIRQDDDDEEEEDDEEA